MFKYIQDALKDTRTEQEILEEVEIEASLTKITAAGEVFIDFSPAIVIVPNDWRRLWNIEEREKMSLKDREAYEEELLKIMHVIFT